MSKEPTMTALEAVEQIQGGPLTYDECTQLVKDYAHSVATQALNDAAERGSSCINDPDTRYRSFDLITTTKIELP